MRRLPFAAIARQVLGLLGASGLALSVHAQAHANAEVGIDRRGGDYRSFDLPVDAPALCASQCAQEGQCRAWTYVKPGVQGPLARCWLKNVVPAPSRDANTVSGVRIAVAPPPLPVPTPAPPVVNSGGFLGCYRDTSVFDLDGHLERSAQNTPQRCAANCRARGFAYAAVQYGESCLCGNRYGRYGPAPNCNYACTGDRGQVCGGYNANSVYATGLAPAPAPAPTPVTPAVPVAPPAVPVAPPIAQPSPPPTQANATGTWNWQATCPEGTFHGDFGISAVAPDGSFSGGFANGNGSLQGRVQGQQVVFLRTLFDLRQTWTATVAGNRMEQGAIQRPTEQKAACGFTATRVR